MSQSSLRSKVFKFTTWILYISTLPEAEPRKRRAKWEEMLDTNPAANTLRHPREFRVAGLSHNISQKKTNGWPLLRVNHYPCANSAWCGNQSIQMEFATILLFTPNSNGLSRFFKSMKFWFFGQIHVRSAHLRNSGGFVVPQEGPRAQGETQTTFEAATLPDLWSTFLVMKLEGLYIFYMDFVGFCTWHSTTFLDAIGNFVTAASPESALRFRGSFPSSRGAGTDAGWWLRGQSPQLWPLNVERWWS